MRSIWAKTAKERPMAATAPLVALGASAPDFRLPATDGRTYSFANMQRFAKTHDFPFPYLHDADQTAGRAYGAVCTPDFFGYDAARRLKYRGRLDEGRMNAPPAGARRELLEAMRAIAVSGETPSPQLASMGCSIKSK